MAGKGKVEQHHSSKYKSSKISKRAKSFKDDIIERINHMRLSPGGSTKSSSPTKSLKISPTGCVTTVCHPYVVQEVKADKVQKEVNKLYVSEKEVLYALKYFQDVIEKNMTELLPGSATIVLETVISIFGLIGNNVANEESSVISSSHNQLYQSIAEFTKFADDVLIYGEQPANLVRANVVIKGVRDAVVRVIQLYTDRLQDRSVQKPMSHLPEVGNIVNNSSSGVVDNNCTNIELEVEVPLSPREQEILRQTSIFQLPGSVSPPPKPPLPFKLHRQSCQISPVSPDLPPLPPKQRLSSCHSHTSSDELMGSSYVQPEDIRQLPNSCPSSNEYPSHFTDHPSPSLFDQFESGRSNMFSKDSFPTKVMSNSLSCDSHSALNDPFWSNPGEFFPSSAFTSVRQKSPEQSSSSCEDLIGPQTLSNGFGHRKIVNRTQKCVTVQRVCVTKSNGREQQTLSTQITQAMGSESRFNPDGTVITKMADAVESIQSNEDVPPALPEKQRRLCQYDNVPPPVCLNIRRSNSPEIAYKSNSQTVKHGLVTQRVMVSDGSGPPMVRSQQTSAVRVEKDGKLVHEEMRTVEDPEKEGSIPPPLPLKKRHIMAYMEFFRDYAHPSIDDFYRSSTYSLSMFQNMFNPPLQQPDFLPLRGFKMSNSDDSGMFSLDTSLPEDELPPVLPPKQRHLAIVSPINNKKLEATNKNSELSEKAVSMIDPSAPGRVTESAKSSPIPLMSNGCSVEKDKDPLNDLDVTRHLVFKSEDDDGPELRGGTPDALVVYAVRTAKNQNDFLYQEAFLMTYRTFLTPRDLIDKLLYRYRKFSHYSDLSRKRLSRNAFSLLVRVVDELCINDLNDELVNILLDLVFQLLSDGDMLMGKALRGKILEKCEAKRAYLSQENQLLPSIAVSSRPLILTDFKAEHLAEQMTLLDARLFEKMEIAEMLIWSREQSEEQSPNLTMFTEHFNKMSYWARSRILEQDDPRDRERIIHRFIKIMKHLRKLNNFNSYLALLSALDSAPIRRLDWPKHISETLKEYCELIDSSASFRAYRLALSEAEPPCIPYIGLILQDLTFVHIGNNDFLPDGKVNFAKRWQQFNILDNMRKFHVCNYYTIKKNEQILSFFANFDEYLDEETMWQISESIKPRGGRSKADGNT